MKEIESEQLIKDCRELLTNRMRSSMSRVMGDIEDVLFEMATGSGSSELSSQYIDAVREVRMKKREIQVRFENRFHDLFDHSVREIRKGNRINIFGKEPVMETNVVRIKRTGQDGYDQRIAKMRNECRIALVELDLHVSGLLQIVPGNDFNNPMQPSTVFGAFRDSCIDIQISADIRQLLVDMFDKHMSPALQCVYEDLNTLFQSYSIGNRISIDQLSAVSTSAYPASMEYTGEISTQQPSLLVGSWVANRIKETIADTPVPEFVSTFLFTVWKLVLERNYGKKGEASQEWGKSMQVVEDMVVCARLTDDKDKRRQQIWMLPGLIYRLKTGMKSVGVPLKQQADFLSELKAHHARITDSSVVTLRTN